MVPAIMFWVLVVLSSNYFFFAIAKPVKFTKMLFMF